MIRMNNMGENEVNRRIMIAWKKCWSLKKIMRSYSIKCKSELMNSCVLLTLAYGSQTWSTTKDIENKIRITLNSMLRSILNIKRRDKVRIIDMKRKLKGCRKKKMGLGGTRG